MIDKVIHLPFIDNFSYDAIRICIYIANTGEKVTGKEIAKKLELKYNTTILILKRLVKANLLMSVRGATGGYLGYHDLTLREIINAINAPIHIRHNNFSTRINKSLQKFLDTTILDL